MPLAEAGGRVPLITKHARKRRATLFYQTRAADAREYASDAGAKSHSPGEDAVTAGRAHGGWCVSIGEGQSFPAESIQIRGWHFGLGVVTGNIAIAQVVSQNENDVRLLHVCLLQHRTPLSADNCF